MFDLASAKSRLSITDNSKDAEITLALSLALSVVEDYLDRKLEYKADETATLFRNRENIYLLRRYPVESLISIDKGDLSNAKISKSHGILFLSTAADEVELTYAGGYKTLPPVIEMVLWQIFDAEYPGFANPGSVAPASGQVISSISVPDVGTIKYESSGSASGISADLGILTASQGALLDRYRAESVVGCG